METTTNISTSIPQTGTEEQLVNGKSEVGHTSAEQEQVAQVATDTSSAEDDPYSLLVVDCTVKAKKLVAEVDAEVAAEASEDKAPCQDDWNSFLEETNAARSAVEAKLAAGEEVHIQEFLKAGCGFADMPPYLQRGETKKNVADLQKSLINSKKFYRPIEVVTAKEFIEAGLGTPLRTDAAHTPISLSDKDIDFLYVRPDGKQRSCAYANLFSDKKFEGKEAEFDVRVKLCPSPVADLPTYIREIQTAAVWDEKTKRQATVAQFKDVESGLSLMNHFMEESGMTARAAYKLIYRKDGYKKSLYETSVSGGTLHKDLQATPELIKRAKHDYEAMKVAFRCAPKYLKNSAAVDALIDVFTSAADHQNEAVEEYLTFLKTLDVEGFKDLDMVKSVAQKKAKFLEIYEEFKTELATRPAFKAEVNEMVQAAEEEFKMTPQKTSCKKKVKASCEASYYKVGAHTN